MRSSSSPHHNASPTGSHSDGSVSTATDVPPLVRTDVSSPLGHSSNSSSSTSMSTSTALPTTTTTTTTTTTNTGINTRRTLGSALPPLPAPASTSSLTSMAAAARHSPATSTSATASAAHNTSATPSATTLSFTSLHPVTVTATINTSSSATPHVSGSTSPPTVYAPSAGDAHGQDDGVGGGGTAGDGEPILTNGSIALAEFTSLLKPSENTNVLREHIIHLLQEVDTEDTLVRIARTLEAQEGGGAASPADVSSTTWNDTSRMTPTMTNTSQSTRASVSLSATHRRRSSAVSRQEVVSFEALAGFSFLHSHPRTTSVHDTPSSYPPSEDTQLHSRSMRGLGGPMEVSFSSQSSHHPQGADSRRTSHRRSRDDAASSSLTATRVSQLSESAAALRVDPLKREVPVLPTAVRSEGRRVAVSAAPCMAPPGFSEPLTAAAAAAASSSGGDANSEAAAAAAAAAAAESPGLPLVPLRVIPKTVAEEQQLRRLLRRCHSFANLEADVLEDVMKAMEKEMHAAGTAILEQGQDSSEKMYLVGEGTCEAIKNGKSMGPLQPGGTFGELELMYKQAKCAATIRCVTRCVLYSLDEASYHRAVMTNSLQKRKKFENLTLNVPFLRCMPDFERMKIAEALVTREYRRGQSIIKFGSPGTYMHFVVEGEVKVVGRNNGRRVEVVRLHAGDVVGELEFLFKHLTVADVIATSHRVVTACISREHFELIIGPIQDRLKEFVATSSTYESYYLSEVADKSVRSELSRIESSRKHRRVASRDAAMTLDDVNPQGEVLLSAPLALLHGKGARSSDANNNTNNNSSSMQDRTRRGRDTAALAGGASSGNGDGIDDAARESVQLPKALLRFPFAQVSGKDVAVLALREDGLIMYWNSVLERLTSYSAEEVVGQSIYSFLLAEREQHLMLKAITTARNFAGDVDAFLERPSTKVNSFTLARSDGLTKATVQLTVVPPVVSAGGDAAEVVLGFGEEVKQGPQRILEQPQWLSAQIRGILADGSMTFEERLELIAETLNNFESTYRAMTVSTERLRVVNIRQMVGHVLMDFGSEFVTRGVSVRQRFDGLPSERAYLDADLLPECLRYAMRLCLKFSPFGGGIVTIMITVTEKNGLEFLIVNFNLAGDLLPEEIAQFFDVSFDQHGHSTDEDSSGDEEEAEDEEESHFGSDHATPRRGLPPRLRRKLRRVQRAVEDQGGTLRIQRNPEDANIVFLIPYMPASDQDVENASVEESLHTLMESSSQSISLTGVPGGAGASKATAIGVAGAAGGAAVMASMAGSGLLPGDHNADAGSVSVPATPGDESALLNGSSALHQPNFSFTTCLAEDTPAHRIMLSSFLWERRHAVLTAFKFEDVVKLFGVADILIIDLQQSVITSLHDDDPINRLREMLRHMAVIITANSFDLVSSDTYEAAGFITLKKPCTPVQAMKAIRRAEEKSAVVKLERIRIEQTRETLARNSRGAWRRGALLGKGAFGEVYEAVDVLTGGKMAVKEMRLGGNDAKIEQFVQEISTMCNLQHPNIIHYFYCEESKEQKVIRVFMEFAGGGTLQSLLKKKGKLEHGELRALLRDVVEGLAYIHSQHYVHGDIKTANVLLSAEGKGKIGDFGTARTVREGELIYVMQGSPLYMSPECMSAGEENEEDGTRVGYSFPSDIWSLGCVAMEMATTKPPFSHIKNMKGPAGLTNFITSLTDVPDLSPLFKCEPSVVEFVSACLNPDPSQRATAQELLQMSLFSESTHVDRASAVKALKRAQLLHVLNKFVAFQEPEEAHELERRRNRFKVRRRSSDFFSSSDSSGHEGRGGGRRDRKRASSASSSFSSASDLARASQGVPNAGPATQPGQPQQHVRGEQKAGDVKKAAGTAEASQGGTHNDSEAPRRSETVARAGDDTNTASRSGGDGGIAGGRAAAAGATGGTLTNARENSGALPAEKTTQVAAVLGSSSGNQRNEAARTEVVRTLRRWHSSSSSEASPSDNSSRSSSTAAAAATTTPTSSAPDYEDNSAAPVTGTSAVAAQLAQATAAGGVVAGGLHTPLRHHADPHYHRDEKDDDDDDGDEPDARNPALEDAYDLSPTPKKRSKTQSRPPPLPPGEAEGETAPLSYDEERPADAQAKKKTHQQQQQQRATKDSVSRRQRQPSTSSSSSSSRSHSNSTNSNEAAFFATSSSSDAESSAQDSDDAAVGDRASPAASDALESVADRTMVGHATTMRPQGKKEETNTTSSSGSAKAQAVKTAVRGSAASRGPLAATPERPVASRTAQSSLRTPDRSIPASSSAMTSTTTTTSAAMNVSSAQHMPTFAGRRRNVTLDDEGNIVTFQRFTSGGGSASTPRVTSVASASATPLHDHASPLGDAAVEPQPSHAGINSVSSAVAPPSPGMVTVSSSGLPGGGGGGGHVLPPPMSNASFAQPPNMSFFNYSFNKNISFMGANIDEVLSSAANDFLSSLAAPRVSSHHHHHHTPHLAVPGASSVFSTDTHPTPSPARERRGSAHSSTHSTLSGGGGGGGQRDSDGQRDHAPIFSSPLAPDTPTTNAGSNNASGDGIAGLVDAGNVVRTFSNAAAVDSAPSAHSGMISRSPSSTLPARHRSIDATMAGDDGAAAAAAAVARGRQDSPLPQMPPLNPDRTASSHSGAETETASSTSPRDSSVPLVGAGAALGRRPPRARPPISNQSFFVVEDLGGPSLANYSMAASYTPFFNISCLGANATASVAPVSAAALSSIGGGGQGSNHNHNSNHGGVGASHYAGTNGGGGGGGGPGSMDGESTNLLLRHNPNIAVVAPAPLSPGLSNASSTVRNAWRHNRRRLHNNNNSSNMSNAANNSNSQAAVPPHLTAALATATGTGTNATIPTTAAAVGNRNSSSTYTPLSMDEAAAVLPTANGAVVSVAPVEDSLYDEGVPSSAAFDSAISASSHGSSYPADVPFLTAERLKQATQRTPSSTSAAAGGAATATPPPLSHQQQQQQSALLLPAGQAERAGSEGRNSVVLFNSLTSHEESPLFTYLRRLNQSLVDVSARLQQQQQQQQTRRQPSGSSNDGLDRQGSPSAPDTPGGSHSGPGQRSAAAAPVQRLNSPLLAMTHPPRAAAAPVVELPASAAAAAARGGGTAGGRNSLPRPVSSITGSAAASMTKGTARGTPQLGPQMGHSNPLWPLEGGSTTGSGGGSTTATTPSAAHHHHLAGSATRNVGAGPAFLSPPQPFPIALGALDSTTDAPPGVISAWTLSATRARTHSSGGSSSAEGNAAGMESLLHTMLQRVNTLIEQLAHLPPPPPQQAVPLSPSPPPFAGSSTMQAAAARSTGGVA